MIYVYKDRIINVEWTVLKGTSTVKENFDRALVKLFLIGPHEKFLLKANAKDGIVSAEVPQGLPEGVYSVEIIYIKNWLGVDRPPKMPDRFPIDCRGNDRCIMRSRKDNLFAITEYESEATEIGEGEVVIRVKTSTASYGYDGLSAYEIAVLRGDFEGTEGEWLEWTHERIVSDVKDLLDKLKSRDTRFVVKTQSQRDNLKDLREGDEVYVIDDGIAYILETENGKRTWKPCDYGTVTSKYILSLIAGMPGFVADRAIADEFGKRIVDEYLTRDAVRNYMSEVFNDLFVNNPPTIMDGMITVDMLSDAVKQLIGFGPIVNFPDDEFLTTKGGRITPKDRNYDPNNYSGMGRKILRKNMVNGVNVLTQKMMSCPNTIYVITYDYSLRGQTITVPENCVLQFEGGSLKNGSIDFNKSVIEGEFRISNIIITGNYISSVIAPLNNTKEILQSIIDGKSFQSNEVLIINFSNNHIYNWEGSLLINKKNIKLVGGGIIYGHIQVGITDAEFLELGYNSNNTLSNFNIEISGLTFKKEGSDRTDNWVYLTSFQRDDIKGQAIQLLNVVGVNISNCIFNNVPYGIVYGNNPQYVNQNVRRVTISNNRFERTNGAVVTIPHGIDNPSQYEYTEYGDTVIIGNTMYCAEYCLDLEGIDGALVSSNKMFTADKGDIIINNTYNVNIIGNNMFGESCEKFMVVFRNKCNKIVINGNIFNYFKLNPNNLSDRTFETRDQGAIGFESTVTTSGCIISGNGFYNINAGTPIVTENGSQITALSIMGNEYSNVLNLPLPIINNRGAILGSFECDYKVSNDQSVAFNGETLDYTEENIYNTYIKVLNTTNKGNSYPECIVNTKHGKKYVTIDKAINGKAIIVLVPSWIAAGGDHYSFLLDNVYYKVSLNKTDTPIQYLTKVINAIPSEFYDTWIIGGVGYIKAKEEGLIRCPFMKTPASNNIFNIFNFSYGWNVEYKENGKTLVSDNVYSHELPQYLTKSDDGLHIHLNRVDTNYQTEIIFRTDDPQNIPLNQFSFNYLVNPTITDGYQILFIKNIFGIVVNTKADIDNINNSIYDILTQIYSDVCTVFENRITITTERQLRPVRYLYMLSGSNPIISNITNKTNSYYFTNVDGTLISNVIIAERASKINSANKTYKIVSDIDLNGATLTLPSGCTLDLQGGSFSNGTIVGSSIGNTYLRPEWFGAKGNNSTDDSAAFQMAINLCNSSNCKVLKLKEATYLIDDITIPSNISIIGADKYKSVLKSYSNSLDTPILRSDDSQGNNIVLRNLTIESSGERTEYTVKILNKVGVIIDNCYFVRHTIVGDPNDFHGIFIGRKEETETTYITKFTNNRINQCCVTIEGTDGYIDHNEIWGIGCKSALHLIKSGNHMISNNQIVGGSVYGAIYCTDWATALKIFGNYFDGSSTIVANVPYGLNIDCNLTYSLISNNNFWHIYGIAIRVKTSIGSIFNGNVFENNDTADVGVSDIVLESTQSGSISNNSFVRASITRTNKAPVLDITGYDSTSYEPIVISGNIMRGYLNYDTANYNPISSVIKSVNNGHQFFEYIKNSSPYRIFASNGEINYVSAEDITSDPFANRVYTYLEGGRKSRLDNLTYIDAGNISTANKFNFSTIYNNDFKLYIGSTNQVLNAPTWLTGGMWLENYYTTDNYCIQRVISASAVYTRTCNNGIWSSWCKIEGTVLS